MTPPAVRRRPIRSWCYVVAFGLVLLAGLVGGGLGSVLELTRNRVVF